MKTIVTFVAFSAVTVLITEGANKRPICNQNSSYDWYEYYSHSDINDFIDGLACANSNWVKTVSIGRTYESREMRVIEINKAGPEAPIAWIEAGIHAREWISSATATYIINELVNNYQENKDIVDNLNIHILPMANPDGYEFSRTDGFYNRKWRKNRNPNNNCNWTCLFYNLIGQSCGIGVDLNRNWDFHWGESTSTSDNPYQKLKRRNDNGPCSEKYHGPHPFSELETVNIKNYLESLNQVPVLGLALHSHNQLWLWPYGYAKNARPYNYIENVSLYCFV